MKNWEKASRKFDRKATKYRVGTNLYYMFILLVVLYFIFGVVSRFIGVYVLTSILLILITRFGKELHIGIKRVLLLNIVPTIICTSIIVISIFLETILRYQGVNNIYNTVIYTLVLLMALYLYSFTLTKKLVQEDIELEEAKDISHRISIGLLLLGVSIIIITILLH